jgi:hypothetical protein
MQSFDQKKDWMFRKLRPSLNMTEGMLLHCAKVLVPPCVHAVLWQERGFFLRFEIEGVFSEEGSILAKLFLLLKFSGLSFLILCSDNKTYKNISV